MRSITANRRSKYHVLVLAIISIFLFGLLCSCSILRSHPSSEKPEVLKILCYNIHIGKGMDGVLDLKRIADIITKSRADIVALQEVDRFTERSGKIDQLAVLSILAGLNGVYGKTIDFQGGEYGIAILSRCDIEFSQHYLMPERENIERRGFLLLVANKNGHRFACINTHLGLDGEERKEQIATILEITKEVTEPLIIAGDFNETPHSSNWEMMYDTFIDTALSLNTTQNTFPSDAPEKRIDYVWFRRADGWEPVSCKTIPTTASDHLPFFVEAKMPASP